MKKYFVKKILIVTMLLGAIFMKTKYLNSITGCKRIEYVGTKNYYLSNNSKNNLTTIKVKNDREPRILKDTTNENYLIISLYDEEGISLKLTKITYENKNLKLELIESSDGVYTNTGTRIKDLKDKNKYTGKKYNYGVKIKKSDLSNDYKILKITTADYRKNCILKENIKIKKLEKKESGGWYKVDIAPRVTTKIINNRLNIFAKDGCGIRNIKMVSYKNNKEIYSFTASNTGDKNNKKINFPCEIEEEISFNNIENEKIGENKYKVKVFAEDYCGIKNEKSMIITIKSNEKVKSISLNQKTMSLDKGKTRDLIVEWNPPLVEDKSIKWETGNNNVATVNGNGRVRGVGIGETIITATSVNGKKASCKVKVSELEMKITAIGHSKNSKGWGDAVMINSEDEYLLMDLFSYGGKKDITSYLSKNKINKLNIYISHYDPDHTGGGNNNNNTFVYLLKHYDVGTVYLPYEDTTKGKNNEVFNYLIKQIEEVNKSKKNKTEIICLNSAIGNGKYKNKKTGKEYKVTNKFKVGSSQGKVLFGPYSDAFDYNEASLVTIINNKSNNIKYLTAGDIDITVENIILNKGINVKANIFKCNHHGLFTSNSKEFINSVNPEYYFLNYIYYEMNAQNKKVFKQFDSKIWDRDNVNNTVEKLKNSNGYATPYNGQIDFRIYNTGEVRADVERNNHIEQINIGKDTDGNELKAFYNFSNNKKAIITERMKKAIRKRFSK